MVAATGMIQTVAGTGAEGYAGDGGPATSALFDGPSGLAINASGNVFIADSYNDRIRRIDAATGIITTVAGGGSGGDNGPATSARLSLPNRIVLDPSGNPLIADLISNRIRKVDLSTSTITTVAGNGRAGFAGDGGKAAEAELNQPYDIVVDADGHLYIADAWNLRIRRVDAQSGLLSTVGGNGSFGFDGDGGPAALGADRR